MLLDLFSSLDFVWGSWGVFSWLFNFSGVFLFLISYYPLVSFSVLSLYMLKIYLGGSKTGSQWKFKGYSMLNLSIFMLILFCNFWGLMPYMFSFTTQMFVILFISLMIWLSFFVSSLVFFPMYFFSHLTPPTSPLWLSPLLKFMELVSNLIRPMTLCLRLSINMTTGHIFITLLGSGLVMSMFSQSFLSLLVMFLMSFYFLFEFCISVMQAFVFGLLLNQYLDEHS